MAAPVATIAIREKIIATAISQLGVNEDPPNSNKTPYTKWYGLTGPWCAMFVSWCFFMSGLPLRISTAKGFAYCPYGVKWFKDNGAWAPRTAKPKRGWVVFYDFIGRPSHVGIVEGIATDGRIVALEGNTNAAGSRTGGAVMRHYRRVSSGIIGYGIIDYTGSEEFDMDETRLRQIIQEENNAQNLQIARLVIDEIAKAVDSIKANVNVVKTGLAALIRRLPGAPQD